MFIQPKSLDGKNEIVPAYMVLPDKLYGLLQQALQKAALNKEIAANAPTPVIQREGPAPTTFTLTQEQQAATGRIPMKRGERVATRNLQIKEQQAALEKAKNNPSPNVW